MKKIATLNDLLCNQLLELLDAEKQQQEHLQKFMKKTGSTEFKTLLQKNMDNTVKHLKRLGDVLDTLGIDERNVECKVMSELISRAMQLAKNSDNTDVVEAGLIASLKCIKHFEIAEYGTLISYSRLLGDNDSLEILKKSISEEKIMDNDLTQLAEKNINLCAVHQDIEY